MSKPPPLPRTGCSRLTRRAFDVLAVMVLLFIFGMAVKFGAAFLRVAMTPGERATPQAVVVEKQPEFSPEVEASFARAVQAHPELATEGSRMNRRMNELAEEMSISAPRTFESPDWPESFARLIVAEEGAADVETWQKVAVLKYPDLGVAGSNLNQRFLDRTKNTRLIDPSVFKRPDWPMIIADDAVEGLDVAAFKSSMDR